MYSHANSSCRNVGNFGTCSGFLVALTFTIGKARQLSVEKRTRTYSKENHTCEKRPTTETHNRDPQKRPVFIKREIHMSKETHTYKKRPTHEKRDTHVILPRADERLTKCVWVSHGMCVSESLAESRYST